MNKVLVVGFDGATFDIIRPLVKEGRLPNLARMLETGASGSLRSTIPPVTPSAWTTFFTGKNAGRHGIYDFQTLDRQTYAFRTIRTNEHREKTLWQLVGEQGGQSIVVDVPFTYPPQPIEGWMITGYGTPRTPDTVFTYPPDLARRIPETLRPEIKVALPTYKFDRSQRFIDEWIAVMDGRQRLLQYLIAERPWDLFMVVFSITDNMAHVFWTYVDPAHPNYKRPEAARFREAFLNAYVICDRLLGELMASAGEQVTTFVISDHGFGSVRPRQYVYRRLLQGGYIQTAGGNAPLLSGLKRRAVETAVATYTRFPALREWVKGLRPTRRNTLKRSLIRGGIMPAGENVDYGRSRVIPSNFGLRMWINEADRFGRGFVTPAQKETLLDELSRFLLADRDPANGRPIISAVYRGTDLYQGPYAADGPDLVIEYANFFDAEARNTPANAFVEGGHTLDGILLMKGPVVSSAILEDVGLVDLAPTILYALGQPVPPDMDGRVVTEAFETGYVEGHPITLATEAAQWPVEMVRQDDTLSARQEAEVEEQLRQLGYIE